MWTKTLDQGSVSIEPDKDGWYNVGDMQLRKNQYEYFFEMSDFERQAKPNPMMYWPNGIVPIKYHTDITVAHEEGLKKQFALINNLFKGCLNIRYFCLKISKGGFI